MRNLIVFGIAGLALGLAVQNAPRVLGWEDGRAGRGEAVPTRALPHLVSDDHGSAFDGEGLAVGARMRAGELRQPDADNVRQSNPAPNRAQPPASSSVEPSVEPSSYTLASELTAGRLQRLVDAGFSSERAEELLRKETELRRAAVESEYAATGTIRALNGSAPAAVGTRLRKELGDEEYARYLQALGEPTRIRVGEVDADSVAANAGIQPGDEIISYAGKRVFNPRELNSLMLNTAEGETVATTVLRDGQPLELFVTGGALGIAQRAVR